MTARRTHRQVLRGNAVRVVVFVVTTALLAGLIVLTLGQFRFGPKGEYHAVFSDVSGLVNGSDVRAAGVDVGSVTQMELGSDHDVVVSFEIERDIPLTRDTHARVRYANLTGDRYLELTSSPGESAGTALPAGDTIPKSRTSPALDLDLLFNGFRPLTRALDADEVNQLTTSVLAVSQGQGSALDELLRHVASLTHTLGDRGELIGQVIDNLTRVLDTLHDNRDEVVRLINGLDGLMTGLARDRKRIGEAFESLGEATERGGVFLRSIRPALQQLVAEVHRLATVFNRNSQAADRYLSQLPTGIKALGRGGAYGSFFNFYLCGVRFKVDGPNGTVFTPFQLSKEFRCEF